MSRDDADAAVMGFRSHEDVMHYQVTQATRCYGKSQAAAHVAAASNWMQTHSGLRFFPGAPTIDMIDIRDIAEGLSKECRYNGHCKGFYSVAEHSLLVASVLPDHLKLQGLLHDATEAYLKDIPRPLKNLLPGYRELENQLWIVIADRFNLPHVLSPAVKQADNDVLLAEKEQIMGRSAPWSIPGKPAEVEILRMEPEVARFEFMAEFMRLTDARRHA